MFKGNGLLKLIALLFVALAATGRALAAEEEGAGSLDAFKNALAGMGFVVQEGLVDFPSLLDMCCKCQVPSCFANNASVPYGVFVLPPAPDQPPTVPNPYSEWFAEDQTYPEGWSWFWRMRADEAVVYLGTTPPEMDYFGFTGYLFDRYRAGITPPACTYIDDQNQEQTRQMPPSALNRFPLFASLGDTVNNRVIHCSGNRNQPFLSDVILILASDRKVERRVREALRRAGYGHETINTVVVSSDLVRLGVESEKDSLSFILRGTSDMTPALQQYHESPKTLLRVSPGEPTPPSALDPMPLPKLRVRGTGYTEVPLLPLVDQLGQAIVAAYPDHDAMPIATVNWYEGYNCIENEVNCLADNRDTPYIPPSFSPLTYIPEQALVLKAGEFYVAYGVNHKASGKATYSNVSIMGWNKKASPGLISNDDMVGSANIYLGLSPDDPAAGMLYACAVARPGGCNALPGSCLEVGYACSSGIAEDEPMALVFRAYLEHQTNVAPAYGELVIDRIIKFSPKAQ